MTMNRRCGLRVPARLLINQYEGEGHRVCLSFNVGTEGIYLYHTGLPPRGRRTVGLEFQLPGQSETIWAKGEIRYCGAFGEFCGTGIAFVAMANAHWDMVQDWVYQARLDEMRQQVRQLGSTR